MEKLKLTPKTDLMVSNKAIPLQQKLAITCISVFCISSKKIGERIIFATEMEKCLFPRSKIHECMYENIK